jgi:hypothetical protein
MYRVSLCFITATAYCAGFLTAPSASAVTLEWIRQQGTVHEGRTYNVAANAIGNVYFSGTNWPTNYNASDAFVSKYCDGLGGDFNNDGMVDAADYVIWRNGPGTKYSQTDYDAWRAKFDAGTISSIFQMTGGVPTVPEPSTLIGASLVMSVVICRRNPQASQKRMRSLVVMLALISMPTQANGALTDGLISYWPFDGNGSDASPFGRNLTLQGGVGFATGLYGESLDIHKNQDTYAQRLVDDAAYDFGGGDFTVQAWVNYYSTSTEQVLIEKFTGTSGPGWTFTKPGDSFFQFYGWPAGYIHRSPGPVTASAWHQLLARRTGNDLQIWFDGATIGSGSMGTIPDSATPLYIGRRNPADRRDFSMNGRLDEVAIWNRALSDSEIAHLYNVGVGNPVLPTQPVAGDFNDDRMVDAADYVVWRDGQGTPYNEDDYDAWRANFGYPPTSSPPDPPQPRVLRWEIEATVTEIHDPDNIFANVRLGDPVRGFISYDLNTPPDSADPHDALYQHDLTFEVAGMVIENPRDGTELKFLPDHELFANVEVINDREDEVFGEFDNVTAYQSVLPPEGSSGIAPNVVVDLFGPPDVLAGTGLPVELDLNDWPDASILFIDLGDLTGSGKPASYVFAEIHTLTPIISANAGGAAAQAAIPEPPGVSLLLFGGIALLALSSASTTRR